MDSYNYWLFLTASGIFAGILSGFLGLGGMSVYVPLLIWMLHPFFPNHAALISAVLINSFIVVVIVGLASWASHHRHGTIRYRTLPPLSVGASLGTVFGYSMAIATGLFASMDLLFGFYLLAVGSISLIQKMEGISRPTTHSGLFGMGLASGTVGGFIGFNGNSVLIPLLRTNGLNVKESMATGQLIGLIVSAMMVIMIGFTFGFRDIHVGLCSALAIGGFIGSYLGANIKQKASFRYTNMAFAASCWAAGGVLLLRFTH